MSSATGFTLGPFSSSLGAVPPSAPPSARGAGSPRARAANVAAAGTGAPATEFHLHRATLGQGEAAEEEEKQHLPFLPTAPASARPASSLTLPSLSPPHARFYYKLVARAGPNRFLSIYDGETEYVIGQTLRRPIKLPGGSESGSSTQRSHASSSSSASASVGASGSVSARGQAYTSRRLLDETLGGLFVCRTAEEAMSARLPEQSALFCAPRVLLKCLCFGEQLQYAGSTLAFSHLRPVAVLPLPFGWHNTKFSERTRTRVQLSEARNRLPPFVDPRHKPKPKFRGREEMTSLGHQILALDRRINDLTRAQLGVPPPANQMHTPRGGGFSAPSTHRSGASTARF